MEKEIYGYIYKIRNTVNEKVYIGLTTRCFDRRYSANGEGIERVYNYYVNQRKYEQFYNKHLLNSIEKYGFEAFEVIKEFDIAYSEEELKEKEKYWIAFYKCNDINYGYNRTEGGDSFLKGKDNPNYKERTKVKCGYCGKEVERLECFTKNNKNNFCSKKCFYEWKKEGLKGEDNPNYKGFVVIFPNGQISEEMTWEKVANYLNVNENMITDLAKEKTCYIGNYENIRYIRVLYYEDYLKERENKSNEEFINMCKHMVEEAKILYRNKKEETSKKLSEDMKGKRVGENNPMYGKTGIKNPRAKSLICIFPDKRIIKDVCITDLANELGITKDLVRSILRSHKPYKPTHKRLKYLEGIIIMSQEDYLKDYLNINDNDKAS